MIEPSRADIFKALILRNDSVFVHMMPKWPGAVVPAKLKTKKQIVLQLGYDMPVPIPDLLFNDNGLSATLTFGGKPFKVSVPWESIYAMVGSDAKGVVFKDSCPPDVLKEIVEESERREEEPARPNVISMDAASRRLRGRALRSGGAP